LPASPPDAVMLVTATALAVPALASAKVPLPASSKLSPLTTPLLLKVTRFVVPPS